MKNLQLFRAPSLFCVAILCTIPSVPAFAAGQGDADPAKLMTQLSGLFVVATIMESALSTVFNWKLYREFFNSRGVKTLVMIVFGLAVVVVFDYDIFRDIVRNAGGADKTGPLSKFLSALVLAGGSSAIYELFKALGLRPPVDTPESKPRPEADKAWASVQIIRDGRAEDLPEDIKIHFELIDQPTPEQQAMPPLAGTVAIKDFRQRLRGVFFIDQMRLPSYGGRTLKADKVYRIMVTGAHPPANPNDTASTKFEKQVYVGRFAGGAIVDFTCKI